MHIVLDVLVLLWQIIYYNLEALYRMIVPPSARSIRGQVALVTGGGRGIGQRIAVELAKHGAVVAVLDIDEGSAKETAQMITESGGKSSGYRCDVTKVSEVAEAVKKVRQDLGDVDILVNNAGVLACKSILDLSEAEIRRTLEVNLVAQFWTVREVLPSMIAKKRGHIVIISSMAGKDGSQVLTDYCASKFGASGFGEALYDDLKYMNVTGVNVMTVYPMFILTRLVTDLADRVTATSRVPSHFITAETVATSVVDGMRRNYRYVYLPPSLGMINVTAIMPFRLRQAVKKVLNAGFVPTARQN